MKKISRASFIKLFIVYCLLFVAILFPVFATARIDNIKTMSFDKANAYTSRYNSALETDGDKFKVLMMNDLHFMGIFAISNNLTYKKIDKVLEQENPNLVIINGDVVWGIFNWYLLDGLAQYFESKQIYWCYNFGNHDYEFGDSATRLAERLEKYEYSLFNIGYGNLGNLGNYVVEIKNSSSQTKFAFVMLNSGKGYITPEQVEWYEWQINGINSREGHLVNNAFVMHIPFKQVETSVAKGEHTGEYIENISPLKNENGLLEKIVELGSTKYIYHGHDHPNDFEFMYQGIRFRSTRGSSYSGYMRGGQDRGVTVIDLDLESGVLEDRTIEFSSL